MAVKRKLNSVTQKVGKHKRRGKKLAPAEKLKARKAYALYKKRRNSRDKKFDTVRAAFRAGKKRKGRPNKASKKLKLASKSTALRRKAGSIAKKGKLGKKDARKLKALRSGAKKVYSGNRKRIQMSAKDKAHEIAGQATIIANKLIVDAKKTGNPKKIAAAKKAAHKILVKAKNQAVQVIQDTRRDLTTMRKNAGRSKTKKVVVSKKSSKGKHKSIAGTAGKVALTTGLLGTAAYRGYKARQEDKKYAGGAERPTISKRDLRKRKIRNTVLFGGLGYLHTKHKYRNHTVTD